MGSMSKIQKCVGCFVIFFLIIILSCLAGAQVKDDTVRIGLHGPFTGPVAYSGELMKKGFLLAVEEINQAGGIKIAGRMIKIKPFAEDDRGAPAEGVAVTEKLITRDQVHAIVGPFNSSVGLAVAELTDRYKVVRLVPIAVADAITTGHPWVFRNCPNQTMQTVQNAEYAMKQGKWKKFALLLENTDYGRGGGETWSKVVKGKGGEVVATEYFNLGDTDFATQLTKIKAKDPEGVFLVGLITEGAQILRQARQLGMKQQFFGLGGFASDKFIQLAGGAAEGLINNSYWEPNPKIPKSIAFKENFEKFSKMEAEMFSAATYDAVYILKEAFEKAGVLATDAESKEALRKAMHKVDYVGAQSRTTFDSEGQATLHVYIVQVKEGKRRIIGP
jgi:branched-chain amino acid transport system substrate-binding protein